MPSNPWVERILRFLAEAQQQSADAFLEGILPDEFPEEFEAEPGSEQGLAIESALAELSRSGLIYETTYANGISLTESGWEQVLGRVPGSEKDGPFLRELVKQWHGREHPQQQGMLSASGSYASLGWTWSPPDAFNVTARLEVRGLIYRELGSTDVFVRPTYEGLQAAEAES